MDKKTKDKLGILIIVVVVILSLVLFYTFNYYKKKNQYDEHTFCPINIPYNQTLIIVDKSDKWDKRKANKIKKIILKTKHNLKLYERLTIQTIPPSEDNDTFDYCNPGNKANPLYQNPRRILKKYKESFEEPLKKLTEKLMQPSVSSNSPILETLADSVEESEGEKVKIYLISDLLENDSFDFYKQIPSLDELLEQYEFKKNKLSLLRIEYIERSNLKDRIHNSLKLFEELANSIGAKFEKHRLFKVKYTKVAQANRQPTPLASINMPTDNTLYSVCYKDIVYTQSGIFYSGCQILTTNCKSANLKLLIKNKMKINAQRNLNKRCIK